MTGLIMVLTAQQGRKFGVIPTSAGSEWRLFPVRLSSIIGRIAACNFDMQVYFSENAVHIGKFSWSTVAPPYSNKPQILLALPSLQ